MTVPIMRSLLSLLCCVILCHTWHASYTSAVRHSLEQWRLYGLELQTGLLLALRTHASVQVDRTLCIRAAGLVRVLTRTSHVHL